MFCEVVKLSSIQEESEETKKKNLLLLNDVPTYHQSISSSELSIQDTTQEQHSQEDIIDVSSLLDATSVNVDDQGPIKFCLWVSFAEIYNEYIYDLLEPISMNKETRKRTTLRVGDDRKGNPYVKGLTEIHVNNAEEACKLLKIGRKNQKIASTKLNQNSSRSHCIFTLKILRVVDTKEPHVARVSRLSFVDLAGSERYAKTQNTGARLKEAGNINTSIMTLGKCVELLRYNQNHVNNQKNIPFRESKLTRLFQGFFCGKGKASMIVNVNQCASAFDETLHALKFSAIAKKVTTVTNCAQPTAEISNFPRRTPARSTRSSVAWADGSLSTPAGKRAKMTSEDINATPVPEQDASEVAAAGGNQQYLKLIADLQAQLIEERKQKAFIEMKIREEVCQEMAEQIVEIEKNYNERMIEGQRATEELYEKRMDILSQSVKKARKRPRVERVEDDDDEWISSVVLHREQVKNKELSARIVELEQKLAALEDEKASEIENRKEQAYTQEVKVASIKQEAQVDAQNKELCEIKKEKEYLKNEIDVIREKAEELTADVKKRNNMNLELQEKMAALEQDKNKIIEKLKNELASRNDTINMLEKARSDEQVKVVAEKQIVEKQNKEVQMAKQQISDLENEMSSIEANHKAIIESLKKDLAQREEQILSLKKEEERDYGKDETVGKLEEEISRVKEQKEKEISDLRKGMEHRDKKILSLEEIMAKNEKMLPQMDAHAEELRRKDCEINALTEQVGTLQSNQKEECQSLKKELTSRAEQLEHLERSLKDCKVELETKSSQLMAMKKVQGGRSLTPTKSNQNNLVKQLEKRLQESTAVLDKKNSQLISKNNTIAKLESSLKELRRDLSLKEQELNELKETKMSKARDENKDVTIDELNAQLKEQQYDLLNKTKEKEEVEENLKFVEGELQILSSKEKETQEEIKKLTKERDEMKDEVQRWMMQVKNHEETEGNLNKKLETQVMLVGENERKIEELKLIVKDKEESLRQCEHLHNKQVTELSDANEDLQQRFDKAIQDLQDVQARVEERNQKLEDLENRDSSFKDAHSEIIQLRNQLKNARKELQETRKVKNKDLDEVKTEMNNLKQKMEKEKLDEILKVKEECETCVEELKKGIVEQEEVMAKMDQDLISKDEDINQLHVQVETLLHDSIKVKELTKTNEDLDELCERLKIKIFELETEVEKLQQDVKKETTKKDTATQALRDGLEIVKAKKLEFEKKVNDAENEKKELQEEYEMKITDLEQEVERLKSVSSESDEKTDSSEKESANGSSCDANYVYKPVEVESFNLPRKDRVEIDVTPITGSGLPKGRKKTPKAKSNLKRKSSDLTLKEIQQRLSKKEKNCSEDEFTPVSQTKLRKTRSSLSSRSKQSKPSMTASTFSLTTLDEDSENTNPKAKSGRKFLNKLALPDGLIKSKSDNSTDTKTKSKRRKLFKKTEISAPFADSPVLLKSDKRDTPNSRAQDVIMRRLRSREVKITR